ncbi:DUF1819 family protein (plasmid) [Synechocystis sp. B12]|nr:DUF1819 family protein [Synechocystis sp. B12]
MGTATKYTVSIAGSGLRLRESRIIAGLLLEENVLQMGNVESIKRIAHLLRFRIKPLGESLWLLMRDGDRLPLTISNISLGTIKGLTKKHPSLRVSSNN